METFKIYLAGGMTNLTFEEQNAWRLDIKNVLERYECDYNVKCINPVDYYNFTDSSAYDSDLEVMSFDLNKVKNSDMLIVNFNNVYSLGTMAEIAIAYDRGIPIIGLNEEEQTLHTWQYCMCSKIFTDREDMLYYIMNYYLD